MEKYSHKVHYDEMCKWYARRNLPCIPRSMLPMTGLVVPGVAAGFLYITDSTVAFIENYISNRDASQEERDVALDIITEGICELAKEHGVKMIIALTIIPKIQARAIKNGFKSISTKCMVLSKEI